MWRARTHGAVFVPRSPEGSRVAYSLKRLHAATSLRVTARVRVEPARPTTDGVAFLRCSGGLELRGPQARMLFRPSADAHAANADGISAYGSCAPDPPRVAVPERVLRATMDPRPNVWIEFRDWTRRPVSTAICVGRVQHRPLNAETTFVVPASIIVWLAARELNPRRGPVVDMTGELTVPSGIELVIRLGSECNVRGGPGGIVEIARIPVLTPGVAIPISRCEMTPGTPGNPEVSVRLRSCVGGEEGDEMAIGRCVQLD